MTPLRSLVAVVLLALVFTLPLALLADTPSLPPDFPPSGPTNRAKSSIQMAKGLDIQRLSPKAPADTAKSFRTSDGFRMDLLAHEPLVTSPVAMAYDENGQAYVLEMRDYPYTDRKNDKSFTESTKDLPLGRIRLLRDRDGDGVFDESAIFAENLSWPTGIACGKGGVYVAATPDLV
jgi:glucose/arabinose dehydrogenase